MEGYEQQPAQTDYGYASAAQFQIDPQSVEVRLGCSCSLNIPCFDLKTKTCVPVICGFNSGANFVDNRIPRYSHSAQDDDYNQDKPTSAPTSAGQQRQLKGDYTTADGSSTGGSYSNPVINGCKCPSGSTRCYECAVVSTGGKVVQWVLVFIFFCLHGCCVRLCLTSEMPKTPINDEALGTIVLTGLILGLAMLSAMCTASDVGYWVRPWDLRRVYITRWVDWLVTSLLMMWILCWVGVRDKSWVPLILTFDAMMIVLGFIATVVEGNIRWLFFFLSFVMYLCLAGTLVRIRGSGIGGLPIAHNLVFKITKMVVILIFLIYPIIWIFSEGLDHWCASTEATLYGITDLLLKMTFCGIIAMSRPFFTEGLNAPEP